jgi:hypothetical protein
LGYYFYDKNSGDELSEEEEGPKPLMRDRSSVARRQVASERRAAEKAARADALAIDNGLLANKNAALLRDVREARSACSALEAAAAAANGAMAREDEDALKAAQDTLDEARRELGGVKPTNVANPTVREHFESQGFTLTLANGSAIPEYLLKSRFSTCLSAPIAGAGPTSHQRNFQRVTTAYLHHSLNKWGAGDVVAPEFDFVVGRPAENVVHVDISNNVKTTVSGRRCRRTCRRRRLRTCGHRRGRARYSSGGSLRRRRRRCRACSGHG